MGSRKKIYRVYSNKRLRHQFENKNPALIWKSAKKPYKVVQNHFVDNRS